MHIKFFHKSPKIFCIGFNKTGTSSLNTFFNACGFNSTQNVVWPTYSHLRIGKYYFYKYDCFTDGEKSSFVQLNRWFPNSLFVLNTRNEKEWIESRIKHVMRRNQNVTLSELICANNYGSMAKDFYFDEKSAITKWISERRIYELQARAYFKDMKSFIEIDITVDPKWQKRLATFVEFNGINVKPIYQGQIKENSRESTSIIDGVRLQGYYELADEIRQGLMDEP